MTETACNDFELESGTEARILSLIPHRPPMLLINKIVHIDELSSSAIVVISRQSSFYQDSQGVPSWIGLEYMGQTAALIAGEQLNRGELEPHLGILLGSRAYSVSKPYFELGDELLVSCQQTAIVGDSLLKFQCTIALNDQEIANGKLSVLRTKNK